MSDELVVEYLTNPDIKLKEVRQRTESLEERRKVEGLTRELRKIERDINLFQAELEAAPNLRELRKALGSLIGSAQILERAVTDALHAQE